MSQKRRLALWRAAIAACGLWGVALPAALGDDWPTYRGDPRRSGIALRDVTPPLEELWVHEPACAPSPAWPESPARKDVWHRLSWLSPSVTFDRAFQVAVVGERVYYGSSADDTVYCLDAGTGRVCWSFPTGGPVRLAPAVADGRVYVGSDDGCLYCLAAGEGTLEWRYRAGPEDRRLPGNGRMISLWPIRCGVVVDGGAVYFCAGLFPCQGVYLVALDAREGRELWKRKIAVSPQGYLLASLGRLFVPTGRTAPQSYGRTGGEDLGRMPGGGVDSRGGGSFAVLADEMLVHAAENGELQFSGADAPEKIASAAGLGLLVHGPTLYVLTRDRLRAVDRALYLEMGRLKAKKNRTAEEQKRLQELDGEQKPYLKWDVPCNNPYELILAGRILFVGGDDRVVAYRAGDGKIAWTGPVAGKAYGMAAAGSPLLVSTDTGGIWCFAPRGSRRPAGEAPEAAGGTRPLLYPRDQQGAPYEQAADRILQAADVKQGYCLVLGAGTGRLAYEIAKRSQFQVIGLEADPARAAAARRQLGQTGLYGSRISIHCGTLDGVRYQPYFANLITSEEAALEGRLPAGLAEVYRLLRPCGGTIALPLPPGAPAGQALEAWGSGAIPGMEGGKRRPRLLDRHGPPGPPAGRGTMEPSLRRCRQYRLQPGPPHPGPVLDPVVRPARAVPHARPARQERQPAVRRRPAVRLRRRIYRGRRCLQRHDPLGARGARLRAPGRPEELQQHRGERGLPLCGRGRPVPGP